MKYILTKKKDCILFKIESSQFSTQKADICGSWGYGLRVLNMISIFESQIPGTNTASMFWVSSEIRYGKPFNLDLGEYFEFRETRHTLRWQLRGVSPSFPDYISVSLDETLKDSFEGFSQRESNIIKFC